MEITARRLLWFRLVAIALLCAALAVGIGLSRPSAVRHASAQTGSRPNVVLILTDDQRWNTLWAMPNVRHLLADHGVTFRNAFVVNSLCCPSRASILTGRYSHSTGVYGNAPPNGGFARFDDTSTVATWLHDGGYRTALVGKYLNGYKGDYIPPGWDRWYAVAGSPGYYDYHVSDQTTLRAMGHTARDYSTYVFTRRATSFVRQQEPFFLYFTPFTPHRPSIPAPRDERSFSGLPVYRPPSFDEADMSDKPLWMQSLPRYGRWRMNSIEHTRRLQYRSLRSVDRAVGDIVRALRDAGRLNDTMIVFTSDNGYTWGEHRLGLRKEVPYEESIRVPLVIRYDPLTEGAPPVDDHLVLNIDLAPTFAELAGTRAPDAGGRSLLPLLRSLPNTEWRTDFLIEHLVPKSGHPPPTYCAVRNEGYLYVQYQDGEQELYDLRNDPYELQNSAFDATSAPVLAQMHARLEQLCDPPPPGYSVQPLPSPSQSMAG